MRRIILHFAASQRFHIFSISLLHFSEFYLWISFSFRMLTSLVLIFLIHTDSILLCSSSMPHHAMPSSRQTIKYVLASTRVIFKSGNNFKRLERYLFCFALIFWISISHSILTQSATSPWHPFPYFHYTFVCPPRLCCSGLIYPNASLARVHFTLFTFQCLKHR